MRKRLFVFWVLTLSSPFFTGHAAASPELAMRTAAQVSKAYELEQQDKLSEAIGILESIKSNARYDKAYIARMLGIYYWQSEQPSKAIDQLQFAVETGAFKDEQGWQTERMLAELMLSQNMPKQALPHFNHLIQQAEANKISKQQLAEVWLNKARAYYLLQQWKPLLTAIMQHQKLDNTPRLQPLSLQLTAEIHLSRLNSAILTTQKLLTLQPENMTWWQQLSSLYMQTQQYKLALATLVSAERAGFEIPDNLQLSKAQLYSQQGIPERAALTYAELQMDDKDIETMVNQARHWQMAREWSKAQTAWSAVANLNNKYYENVSLLALQQGQYQEALTAINKATELSKHNKQLLKIRAYAGQRNYLQAKQLAEVTHREKPTKQTADWLIYLEQMTKE
jgi:tetratricopeptide (TPR) repeat protein